MNFMTKCFIVAFFSSLFADLDVTASAMREVQRQGGSVVQPLQEGTNEQTTQLPSVNNSIPPRLVQRQQELTPGDDVYQGYSCQSDNTCFHDGRCLGTPYGSSLCNCTEDWLGPQCKFSSASMVLELHLRPLVRRSFMSCLNFTGAVDGVHAANIFTICRPGNTQCWIREGGQNAIKVFFWCLNTGYGMLLTEGKPRFSTRLDSYADTFRKLSRGDRRRQRVDLSQEVNLPVSIRLEEDIDHINTRGPQRLGTTSEGGSESRFNSRRLEMLRSSSEQQSINSIAGNRRNSQRNTNPSSQNNLSTGFSLQRHLSNLGRQFPSSRISNSTVSQQRAILPGRRYLNNLLQAALANGRVSQRAMQRMFGPSTGARKASLNQTPDKSSEYEPDYFLAPNAGDDVSDDMP